MSRLGRLSCGLPALAIGALLTLSACDFGPGSAFLSTPLHSPSGNASHGRVAAILTSWSRALIVNARGLSPNGSFSLTADGAPVAELSSDANGSIHETLSVDDLGVDPRDSVLGVEDASTGDDVLEVEDANEDGAPDGIRSEHASLSATDLAQGGHASTRLHVAGNGDQTLDIEIEDVPAGSYDVFVEGAQRGMIDASSGSGSIEFATNPDAGQVALDFSAVNAAIEIRIGGELVFSGQTDVHIPGVDADENEDGSGDEDAIDSSDDSGSDASIDPSSDADGDDIDAPTAAAPAA